jgi:hypothetical protein
MKLTSTQLESIVKAARATGENQVTTQLADGTVIEIRLRPHPEGEAPSEPILPRHPLALLMHRLRSQRKALN